jgi:glycosyltransferase involved in cell wall biosynthesis
MKKFCFYCSSFQNGGVEKVTIQLCNELAIKGFKVDLVIGKKNQSNMLDNLDAKVNLVSLGTSNKIFSILMLALYLRRKKPDIVISDRYHSFVYAASAKRIIDSKSEIVMTIHSQMSLAFGNGLDRTKQQVKKYSEFMRLKKYCSKVISVSIGTADDFLSIFPEFGDKVSVIYNPVAVDQIQSLAKQWQNNLSFLSGRQHVIISVGRLEPEKGYENLLRAFSEIENCRDSLLVICGEGRERKNLEKLADQLKIQDNVYLPGFVANPYSYLAHADLFVLSSRSEAFGVVLVEALAVGIPVVSTDCPSYGPREILLNGEIGKLVPVDDAPALARAISDSLNDHPGKKVLINRAMHFSLQKAINQYINVLNLDQ